MFDKIRIPMQVVVDGIYEDKDGNFAPPSFASAQACAVDLRAAVADDIVLQPNQTVSVGSGIKLDMSDHMCVYKSEDGTTHEFQLHKEFAGLRLGCELIPRSGLGRDHGLVISNLVGLIDQDFQGEMQIALWNRSTKAVTVPAGERVAQLKFGIYIVPDLVVVDSFRKETERGEKGFNSTGTK